MSRDPIPLLASPEPRRIVVLEEISPGRDRSWSEGIPGNLSLWITIGAAETHVTLLAENSDQVLRQWVAIFGWAEFGEIGPADGAPSWINLADEGMMARAVAGWVEIDRVVVWTKPWLRRLQSGLACGMREIVDRTVGAEFPSERIHLAAPEWLHGPLRHAVNGILSGNISETA